MNIDFEKTISKDELNALPIEVIPVEVTVIDQHSSRSEIEKACTELRDATILGFDTETKPSYSKGKYNRVSIIQLSDGKHAYIFRILSFDNLDDLNSLQPLRALIEDHSLLKVGIGVEQDARALVSDYDWHPDGVVELTKMAEKKGMRMLSLSKMYAVLFGKRITKGQRLTNWEQEPLTDSQIGYAALDAWAGHRIFRTLEGSYDPTMIQNNFEPLVRKKARNMKRNKKGKRNSPFRKIKMCYNRKKGNKPAPSDLNE